MIQLGQPYCIDSLRLLLWDCDMRTYSFYIETSINQKDWEMAVDKQEEQLRSWQSFTFTPRPVVFIKIVGTHNTANEVKFQFFYFKYFYVITFSFVYLQIFHCVHFECPSQDLPKQPIKLASPSKKTPSSSPSLSLSVKSWPSRDM